MKKRTRMSLLLLTLIMLFAFSGTASAASTKSKAMKAYKTKLASIQEQEKPGKSYFAIVYLDNNSTPEIVTYSSLGGKPRILTYRKGKVAEYSSYANTKFTNYYKKKSVLREKAFYKDWDFSGYDKVKVSSAKLSPITSYMGGKYYNSSDKEITKAKSQGLLKKLVGSTKATKIKYYKNTAANRKKYLK